MKYTSAHVIIYNHGKVLILRRSKTDDWMPNHYGLPGGKIEDNETPKEAIKRECKEETNLIIEPENLIFLPKVSTDKKHSFYYTTKFNGQLKLDFEHDDYKWVKPKELSNFKIVPDLQDIVNEVLENIK